MSAYVVFTRTKTIDQKELEKYRTGIKATMKDNPINIVPGHGPLGNKADLTKYRDMLVVAHDRVQKLKTAGKSADEIAASKPFADLDATWGKGFFNGDVLAQVVYSAL
jgi:hypothetical protein